MARTEETRRSLKVLHEALEGCRACPDVVGPVVHGPAVVSRVLLLGQAPGPHEGRLGRPFAWTAGKTLFRWMREGAGVDEEAFRQRVYMAAVLRCFPGRGGGRGDRVPTDEEMARCEAHLAQEVALLRPRLLVPVGRLAIARVLGHRGPLAEVVGQVRRTRFLGVEADVLCLPHPSGVSTWHVTEPGRTLLRRALELLREHPEFRRAFR